MGIKSTSSRVYSRTGFQKCYPKYYKFNSKINILSELQHNTRTPLKLQKKNPISNPRLPTWYCEVMCQLILCQEWQVARPTVPSVSSPIFTCAPTPIGVASYFYLAFKRYLQRYFFFLLLPE